MKSYNPSSQKLTWLSDTPYPRNASAYTVYSMQINENFNFSVVALPLVFGDMNALIVNDPI